jgi:hypothetical protein
LLAGLVMLGGVSCGFEPTEPEIEASAAAYAPPSTCPACPPAPTRHRRGHRRGQPRAPTVGLGCISLQPSISEAARRTARYYVNNSGKCTAKPHREVPECRNFTAETFSDRLG